MIMDAIRKVLVVDDDPVVGKSFDRVLSGKGYAVITACNGEEALNKLHAENYDLVFTDIKMPGMTGLEVAERVKASQPWLPVVIITGYGTEANEARAKAAGVAGFLHKPLSPEMIEGSATKALLEKLAATAPALPEAAEAAAPATAATFIKNVALFLAAPFVGLAYLIAFPFIGVGMLAWMGGKAVMKYRAVRNTAVILRNVGLFAAAPFIGLVYVLALPFVGLAMLAWIGGRALFK
jgi:CheY-like chemotaxis protein